MIKKNGDIFQNFRSSFQILKIFLILISFTLSQDIPKEFYNFKVHKLLFDTGVNWEKHTLLGSIRYQDYEKFVINPDSLHISLRMGIYNINESLSIYGFSRFIYQKYFYGYLYSRIVNDPNAFERYSGLPRDISRGGFNSGETDLSGIGFQNNWFYAQLGRGRESWGSGDDINIALNEDSPGYDYFMFGSNYGNLRVKYIHGFLETNKNNINRYLVAKGLEYSNLNSFLVSLSEIIIYSGYNRSLDFGYLNPISSHLEVELNERLNSLGTSNANAIWQLSIDCLLRKNLRFSGNFIYDEFVLDKVEKDTGKENGKGYSYRLSYNIIKTKKNNVNIFFSMINIGTPTMRHEIGDNNFVQRNKPLGWKNGSDGKESILGVNFFNEKIFYNISLSSKKIGSESIIYRPYERYEDFISGKFPSGNVERTFSLFSDLEYWWKNILSTSIHMNIVRYDNIEEQISFKFGFHLFFPHKFKII